MGEKEKKYIVENSQLMSEWEYSKNIDLGLNPEILTTGCNKKAWWVCKNGHIWEAVISSRAINHNGCPYCSGRKTLTGYNDLQKLNPLLASEWNYKRNGDLSPTEVSPYSHNRAWWKCAVCGNEWLAEIKSRNYGNGCPECGKKKQVETLIKNKIIQVGSLAETNPELAREWHPTYNGDLMPNKVLAGSNEKAWWKCSICGFEWDAVISSRNLGSACPICGRKKQVETLISNRINNIGSLFETNPELASEWHSTNNGDLIPTKVLAGSNVKSWWKCQKGHVWRATIASRAMNHNGCPYCSGRKTLVGYNDLQTLNLPLSSEWNYGRNGDLSPTDVSPYSHNRVWWKCAVCSNEWFAEVKSRNNGNGCPKCGREKQVKTLRKNKIIQVGSFAETKPQLAQEWHPTKNGAFTPSDILSGTNQKAWWVCRKGHEWEASIASRALFNSNCPICDLERHTSFAEQTVLFYFSKCLSAINREKVFGKEIDIYLPDIKTGIEYDGAYYHRGKKEHDKKKIEHLKSNGIRILSIIEGDTNKIESDLVFYNCYKQNYINLSWAIKSLFEILKIEVPSIDIKRDLVSIYEQYIYLEKSNSLAIKHPEIIKEWDQIKNGKLSPDMVPFASNKRVWWICKEGHSWQAVINSRKDGYGCPYCAGKYPIQGKTDLQTVNASLASEWHPTKNGDLTPRDVLPNSNIKVWWVGECGHEWQADICKRNGGRGCPFCAGQKVLPGFNDLESNNPTLSTEWIFEKNLPLLPSEVASNSGKKAWWKCKKCGYEWQAVIGSRNRGNGCPQCRNAKIGNGAVRVALIKNGSLFENNPSLAAEWDYQKNAFDPTSITANSHKKVWWKCTMGHSWEAEIKSRNNGTGCPICAKNKK